MAGKPTYEELLQKINELRIKDRVIESSINAIAIAQGEGDFALTYVNKSFLDMWGYNSKKEVLGRSAIEFWKSPDNAIEVLEALNHKESWTGELVGRKKEGSLFNVQVLSSMVKDEAGKPCCIMGSFMDITGRKHIEMALCESEEKLAGVLASVTDHISIIDDQNNIVWTNYVAKKLFGKDIVGMKCYSAYHGNDKPCEKCIVKKCFEDGGFHDHEIEVIGVDGSKMVFWCTASPAKYDENGRVAIVVEVSRNITERKRSEKELKKLNERLEQRVDARTSELLDATKKLQHRQEELLRHKLDLEKVNKELLDTNNAISVLAKNIDKDRKESEKKIALTINSNIMPVIENLKNYRTLNDHRNELDVLGAYLHDITSSLLSGNDIIINLSSAEMRVAAMTKNGLPSKEIAGKLKISLDTVKTHRRNIRKKLKIHNSNINLTNYLRQKWG